MQETTIRADATFQCSRQIRQILLYADAERLLFIRDLLRSEGLRIVNLVALTTAVSTPDATVLRRLFIRPSGEQVRIHVEDDTMYIDGNTRCRTGVSKYFEFLVHQNQDTHDSHIHLEYYPNHPYLDPESIALVVGMK